jgi:glycosyltransferase involved in cell wall biosynthesis
MQTGGAEMMLLKVASTMDKVNFENVVISLTGNGPMTEKFKKAGISVIDVNFKKFPVLIKFPLIVRQLLQDFRADILQGWMYHGNMAALMARKISPNDAALCWNIRHSFYGLNHEKLAIKSLIGAGRLFSRKADLTIYNSQVSMNQHTDWGYSDHNSRLVPNGFDGGRFKPSGEARGRIYGELGLADSTRLIGMAARFHPMKGFGDLLEAAAGLGTERDLHFVLAGEQVHNSNSELMKDIGRFGLANRVSLLGRRDDMPDLFAAMDILVQPSLWGEAFSNTIGEALMSGTPVVATDVGDSRKIVGAAGAIVPPSNPEDLSREIATLLDLPEKDYEDMSLLARENMLALYSLPRITKQYEDLYMTLSGRQGEAG